MILMTEGRGVVLRPNGLKSTNKTFLFLFATNPCVLDGRQWAAVCAGDECAVFGCGGQCGSGVGKSVSCGQYEYISTGQPGPRRNIGVVIRGRFRVGF